MLFAIGPWTFVRPSLGGAASVALGNAALRHQLAVLRRPVRRPSLSPPGWSPGTPSRSRAIAARPIEGEHGWVIQKKLPTVTVQPSTEGSGSTELRSMASSGAAAADVGSVGLDAGWRRTIIRPTATSFFQLGFPPPARETSESSNSAIGLGVRSHRTPPPSGRRDVNCAPQ